MNVEIIASKKKFRYKARQIGKICVHSSKWKEKNIYCFRFGFRSLLKITPQFKAGSRFQAKDHYFFSMFCNKGKKIKTVPEHNNFDSFISKNED